MSSREYTPELFISPEWDEALKAALWESVRLELAEVDLLGEVPEEAFSFRYQKRKDKIIPMAEKRYSTLGKRTVRRAALIAAILTLILAMSAAVIGITMPQVRYIIFKSNISWDILFEKDDPNGLVEQEFRAIKPDFPEGYEIVDEMLVDGMYNILAIDSAGKRIIYTQMKSEGAGASIDSENGDIYQETIDGQTFTIFESGTVLFDNGYYVFTIDGDCEVEILIDVGRSVLTKK